MAPLQVYSPSQDTAGFSGKRHFKDVDETHDTITTDTSNYAGSFTHGVTIFAGGAPHDGTTTRAAELAPGIVLFTSTTLKPSLVDLPQYKTGVSSAERVGRSGSHARRRLRPPRSDSSNAAATANANPGTVLCTSHTLRPNLKHQGRTNIAGGRPSERLGRVGSFTAGVPVRAGGAARDAPPLQPELAHGTVLATFPHLQPNMKSDGVHHYKCGSVREHQGSVGGFEHDDAHLRAPLPSAMAWAETGQARGARRFGQGHYLAGASYFRGTRPVYGVE